MKMLTTWSGDNETTLNLNNTAVSSFKKIW